MKRRFYLSLGFALLFVSAILFLPKLALARHLLKFSATPIKLQKSSIGMGTVLFAVDPFSPTDEYIKIFTSPSDDNFQCTSVDPDGGMEPMYAGTIRYRYEDDNSSYNGFESDGIYQDNLVEKWCSHNTVQQSHVFCKNGVVCEDGNYVCRCKHTCEVATENLLNSYGGLSHYRILLNQVDVCMSQYADSKEMAVVDNKFVTIGPKENISYLQLANQNLRNCYNQVRDALDIESPWSKMYLRFGIAVTDDQPNRTIQNAIVRAVTPLELSESESRTELSTDDLISIMHHDDIADDQHLNADILKSGVCMGVVGHEMVHSFLWETTLSHAANEGMAVYIHHAYLCKDLLEMGLPTYAEDDIVCGDNAYSYDGGEEKYYSDKNQPNADYFCGYCFWKNIDDTYGHEAFLNIIKRLVGYRYNDNIDFVEDVLAPEIGVKAEEVYNKYYLD